MSLEYLLEDAVRVELVQRAADYLACYRTSVARQVYVTVQKEIQHKQNKRILSFWMYYLSNCQG